MNNERNGWFFVLIFSRAKENWKKEGKVKVKVKGKVKIKAKVKVKVKGGGMLI